MRHAPMILAGILLLLAQPALAAADRDSLLAAWEAHVRELPGTESFEKTGDDTYRLNDTELPYDGGLTVRGTLVRSSESPGYEMEFTHLGLVEFELKDLPEERMTSQVYYYWLADRQTMHYSEKRKAWVNTSVYRDTLSSWYPDEPSPSALALFLNYGIWVVLAGVLVFAFIAVGRQTKKARSLMDDTAQINQMARENIERAAAMHDEVLAIARESRDQQVISNQLLLEIRDSLKR